MLVPCCAGISVTSAGSISLQFDTRPGHAMLMLKQLYTREEVASMAKKR